MARDEIKLQRTEVSNAPAHITEDDRKVDLSREAFMAGGDQSYAKRFEQKVNEVRGGMHLAELKESVGRNMYGETFAEKISDGERDKAIKDKKGQIGQKLKNKKLCEEAEAELARLREEKVKSFKKSSAYKRVIAGSTRFRGESEFVDEDILINACAINKLEIDKAAFEGYYGDDADRFAALDRMVSAYVNLNFDYDFSTEEMFAKESLRLEQMIQSSEAIITILSANPDYWTAMPEENRAALMEKNIQASALSRYYKERKTLVTNDYYSKRLNEELSYAGNIQLREEITIQIGMGNVVRAYAALGLVDSDKTDEEILNEENVEDRRQGEIQAHRSRMTLLKDLSYKREGSNNSWLDFFGYPMKKLSQWFRNKRTADHGREMYDKCKTLFNKFPKLLTDIGTDKPVGFRTDKNGLDAAPPVILDRYFADPVKINLRNTLNQGVPEELLNPVENRAELDSSCEFLKTFVEAAGMYADIRGIVNADTTEMEMAYIDKMQEMREFVSEEKNIIGGDAFDPYLAYMDSILQPIQTLGRGKLREKISDEVFNELNENLATIIQDTGIAGNMDESNIANIPLFTHTPNINDVKQSTIGDCYLVAAMTTLVAVDPDAVQSMFYDYGDGNVLVRLYEAYDEDGNRMTKLSDFETPTVVMKPSFFKLRKHYETGDGNASDCVWPQLIEKAYAAAGFNMKGAAKVDEKGYLTDLEKELTGGACNIAMAHLSGTAMANISDYKQRDIKTLMAERQVIVNEYSREIENSGIWERLSCGIPNYIFKKMRYEFPETEIKVSDINSVDLKMEAICHEVKMVVGTKLMQFKKNCIRNGLPYRDAIENFSARTGIKLADNWDEQTEINYYVFDDNKLYHEVYDINANGQPWPGLIDLEEMEKKSLKRYHDNLDAVLTGREVIPAENGIDTDEFSFNNINQMLDEMMTMSENPVMDFEATVNQSVNQRFEANDQRLTLPEIDDEKLEQRLASMMKYRTDKIAYGGELSFVSDFVEVLRTGGAMSISINHFVTALDLKRQGEDWYVLIKDPFNVYNRTYKKNGKDEKGKDKISVSSDSLLEVFDLEGREVKRHLQGSAGRDIYGGFRGLSWWSLKDLMKAMKFYTPLKKQWIIKDMVR